MIYGNRPAVFEILFNKKYWKASWPVMFLMFVLIPILLIFIAVTSYKWEALGGFAIVLFFLCLPANPSDSE